MSTDPKQPIHPSMLPRLDPEYVAFHNKHFLHLTPPHTLPWDVSLRNQPAVPGTSEPLAVAKVQDFELPNTKFKAFTPPGSPPAEGWPIFIFFHGGGWTLGNIERETSFPTHMCVDAKCVVMAVGYRLAPENPYPAAVEDAVDSLKWVAKFGKAELGINVHQIAVGGSSSGGNLAAILALKAAEFNPPIPLVFQLLVVPVTDNTASVEDLWAENQLSPWLSPGRMMWFRNNYLPSRDDWRKWDASPIFAPDDLVKKAPKAWMGVAELDILRNEAILYGEKLKKAGVEVEIEVYKGAPHPILSMDVRCQSGGNWFQMPLVHSGWLSMETRWLEGELSMKPAA